MKTILKLMIPCLISTASASAETVWVKTPFWQAPYERNVTVKLVSGERNLDSICREYRELVVSATGQTGLDAGDVQNLRNLTDSMSGSGFSALFRVDKAATQTGIKAALEALGTPGTQDPDPLPGFTQKAGAVTPIYAPSSEISVVASQTSLTQISRSLGLKTQRIVVTGDEFSPSVRVFGKDVACDLLSGQARLEYEASGKIQISFDDQKRIDGFYRDVETIVNSVFKKKRSSVSSRAAAIGYRLKNLIENSRLARDDEQGAGMAASVVDLLFDKNLQRTSVWSSINNEYHVTVNGATTGPVHIWMEK